MNKTKYGHLQDSYVRKALSFYLKDTKKAFNSKKETQQAKREVEESMQCSIFKVLTYKTVKRVKKKTVKINVHVRVNV